jgi:FkbM family methyltransferase
MPPARLRDVLTFPSMVRYSIWRLLARERAVTIELRMGLTLIVRPPPARDLTTAHDIFVSQIYAAALDGAAGRDSLIVDVGGNVGYSTLYFARRIPGSRVLAFEPHPQFAAQFERHMALNGFTARVTLVHAAAGTRTGAASLSDDEDSSALVGPGASGAIPVAVVDFFERVGSAPVAVLKMDIEGGEVPLLADPRFGDLDVRLLLLEWHDPSASGRSKSWCVDRLTALGYTVSPGPQDDPTTGLLTAARAIKSAPA